MSKEAGRTACWEAWMLNIFDKKDLCQGNWTLLHFLKGEHFRWPSSPTLDPLLTHCLIVHLLCFQAATTCKLDSIKLHSSKRQCWAADSDALCQDFGALPHCMIVNLTTGNAVSRITAGSFVIALLQRHGNPRSLEATFAFQKPRISYAFQFSHSKPHFPNVDTCCFM